MARLTDAYYEMRIVCEKPNKMDQVKKELK